jgi:hypothetical protein
MYFATNALHGNADTSLSAASTSDAGPSKTNPPQSSNEGMRLLHDASVPSLIAECQIESAVTSCLTSSQ